MPIAKKAAAVTITGLDLRETELLIIGTAPLICNKFSEKTRAALLEKHMGTKTDVREFKDPEANFNAARYVCEDGRWDGVPAGGLKACVAEAGRIAGRSNKALSMASLKGAIRVASDEIATNLVRIYTTKSGAVMDEAVVRNADGSVDIRHRPKYGRWAMMLRIQYLGNVMGQSQLAQLVAIAGFSVGLCEWRPASKSSLSGTFGTFRLGEPEETKAFVRGDLEIESQRIVTR